MELIINHPSGKYLTDFYMNRQNTMEEQIEITDKQELKRIFKLCKNIKSIETGDSFHIHEERYSIEGETYILLFDIGDSKTPISIRKLDKTKLVPAKTNYAHVEPDSQFYTDLNQLIITLESGAFDKEYILKGLKNSIEKGYSIIKSEPVIKNISPCTCQNNFSCIKEEDKNGNSRDWCLRCKKFRD